MGILKMLAQYTGHQIHSCNFYAKQGGAFLIRQYYLVLRSVTPQMRRQTVAIAKIIEIIIDQSSLRPNYFINKFLQILSFSLVQILLYSQYILTQNILSLAQTLNVGDLNTNAAQR
ncbi:hypothetical protein FGO68_gene16182 [Halteria grandinella]|uniref:Uncharacterized protein n=1 Tax=Halteria grandinella TaxID=5974 RepID=A0A8J8SV67_HALGN|nr:hypothetical protein FGO68_gene16182 [Halteria grandinella]